MVALQIFRCQARAATACVTDLGPVAQILVRVHYYPPFLNSLEVRTALITSGGVAKVKPPPIRNSDLAEDLLGSRGHLPLVHLQSRVR